MTRTDFLVIGGGIIGLNIALGLKRKFGDSVVCVIEKESSCGEHASGRNSGVIHAGFYYTANSLKAKFTRDGNRLLTNYCINNKILLNRCGKLVVAKNQAEDAMLDELLIRGGKNGVELEEVSAEDARLIEPRVKTYSRAIYSPTTSSANPKTVIKQIEKDASEQGIGIQYDTEFLALKGRTVVTNQNNFEAGYVVNAAGLYADRIARQFGFSENYSILPFKGLYLNSDEKSGAIRTNIYPVPDLEYPFLGVHFTVQADGHVKIGPTAIPAFWREQYAGLGRFKLAEFLDIAKRSSGLVFSSEFDFKRLAVTELRKYSRRHMVTLAQDLADDVSPAAFKHWAKPGIRAQLYNTKQRKLEMDFVLEGDDKSFHVLNAVSPGWTCSMPFSNFIVDEIGNKLVN